MPKSGEPATAQIRKLKEMLHQNEVTAKEMRKLITELEALAKDSKDKSTPVINSPRRPGIALPAPGQRPEFL